MRQRTSSESVIAQLYQCRWQIELFFKWIKQFLRIKAFYGTTPNAVKKQVWLAICTYVLVATVKRELRIDRLLSGFLQLLSITLLEKKPIFQAQTAEITPLSDTANPKQRTVRLIAGQYCLCITKAAGALGIPAA